MHISDFGVQCVSGVYIRIICGAFSKFSWSLPIILSQALRPVALHLPQPSVTVLGIELYPSGMLQGHGHWKIESLHFKVLGHKKISSA